MTSSLLVRNITEIKNFRHFVEFLLHFPSRRRRTLDIYKLNKKHILRNISRAKSFKFIVSMKVLLQRDRGRWSISYKFDILQKYIRNHTKNFEMGHCIHHNTSTRPVYLWYVFALFCFVFCFCFCFCFVLFCFVFFMSKCMILMLIECQYKTTSVRIARAHKATLTMFT